MSLNKQEKHKKIFFSVGEIDRQHKKKIIFFKKMLIEMFLIYNYTCVWINKNNMKHELSSNNNNNNNNSKLN
jgi:hypothetical protein